jgi:hypothetical protein
VKNKEKNIEEPVPHGTELKTTNEANKNRCETAKKLRLQRLLKQHPDQL